VCGVNRRGRWQSRGFGPALIIGAVLVGCGPAAATPAVAPFASASSGSLAASSTTASSSAAGGSAPGSPAAPAATPAVAAGQRASFPLAVVAADTDLRSGFTSSQVAALLRAGRVLVPCGLSGIRLGSVDITPDPARCLKAAAIPEAVDAAKGGLALLPAGLVDPRVKVLTVDGADLFGNRVVRAQAYPVTGHADALPRDLAGSATAYDAASIRSVVSTGDTCPDRAPSYWANVRGKGWDWTLKGGTARYVGVGVDRSFSGPTGNGWPVVSAVRTGRDLGSVWRIIHDADLAVNDFECPLVSYFTQHDHGTYFTIDPKVAGLMARVGMDVASLASNHITDLGPDGIRQTLADLDRAGVKHAGAGMNLAQAMKPAIVDVNGLKFAILSWDATGESRAATATTAGSLHPTTAAIRKAVALARSQADIVLLMPQWNWPEYSAPFSATALAQRDAWYRAGVDDILGSGTHWAGAYSVTKPDPSRGWRVAVTSHGNFLFGQSWSRQTQEGLIYEVTFRGRDLAQVRLHPYIVMDGAQPNLTDPATDGAFVQRQAQRYSQLP
jgi:poly-gamma-glutamate capsule biosynthesis protein CapA/YwtB (metallophosphatase superfamily)